MPKKLLLFLCIGFTMHSYSQNKRSNIFGKISSDSLAIKDVHIFNKNSQKGTISNRYGEFQMPVKEGDSLLISNIQYESQEIVISKVHIQNLQLHISLKSKVNELNEVQIKEHELTGNLINDAKNTKNTLSKVGVGALDFSKIDFSTPVILDKDEFSRSRTSNDNQLMPQGGNFLGLLSFMLNPLIKEASKIGKKKRRRKREKQLYIQKVKTTPHTIRQELGDSFFTKTLHIPTQHIDTFIKHCNTKGIIYTYLNQSKIEAIDILIKESKPYLKTLENEE